MMITDNLTSQPEQIEPGTDETTSALRPWTTPRLQRLNKAANSTNAKKYPSPSEEIAYDGTGGPS
jgi:hypothetical protein